jgi:hypothetical protein
MQDRLLAQAGRAVPVSAPADGPDLTATEELTGDEQAGARPRPPS